MALMWGWLGLVAIGIGALALGAGLLWRQRRVRREGMVVARVYRLRELPRFRQLAKRQSMMASVGLCCWVVAGLGAALCMSRLIGVDDQAKEIQTRDVVLCLDVSASMADINRDIIGSYLGLVDELTEERIGLVVFDSAAITVMPLTTDKAVITDQLTQLRDRIGQGRIPGTFLGDHGSSLIGDGLASCVSRFDQLNDDRARVIVLATDNLVSGSPIYSLPQAVDLAVARHIVVFGIAPDSIEREGVTQLRQETQRSFGDTMEIRPGAPANTELIAQRVKEQSKKALLALPSHRSFDIPWPGTALLVIGFAGALAARGGEAR